MTSCGSPLVYQLNFTKIYHNDFRKKRIQGTVYSPIKGELARLLTTKVLSHVEKQCGQVLQMQPCYTVSKHVGEGSELSWHLDHKKYPTDKYKVLVFLTESPGTMFDIGETSPLVTTPKVGDVVVFDMKLRHCGVAIPAGVTKCLIGARFGLLQK
jgi:hypothetical protein